MALLGPDQISELLQKTRTVVYETYASNTLSVVQQRSLRDPGIKNLPIWVAEDRFQALPEGNDARQLILDAIASLGRGDEKFTCPETLDVNVEWVGHRLKTRDITAGAPGKCPLPATSERDKFDNLMQDVKAQTTILFVHGGNFHRNCPATVRPAISRLVASTGARCLSVGYRLAPQNPFPAALLDVLIAYMSLLYPPCSSWHFSVPASSIVLAGDSSGGALILALIQVLLATRRSQCTDAPTMQFHQQTVTIPMPAGVAVVSPATDQAYSSLPSWYENTTFDIFVGETARTAANDYPPCEIWPVDPPRAHLYCETSMLGHPLVSPAVASDWQGSPPIWIAMGEERLADAAKVLAQAAAKQGVQVQWELYERMPHTWMTIWPRLWQSKRCMENWANAVGQLTRGKAKTKATVYGIDSRARDIDILKLVNHTPEEVEQLGRSKTRKLKPFTGETKANL